MRQICLKQAFNGSGIKIAADSGLGSAISPKLFVMK